MKIKKIGEETKEVKMINAMSRESVVEAMHGTTISQSVPWQGRRR